MADRIQRRMVDRDESPRDPFAELTKIMGFDPRVPVRPARTAANTVAARPQVQEPEDFGIDLEQELMGAFGEPGPTGSANVSVEPVSLDAISGLAASASRGETTVHRVHSDPLDPATLDLDALSLDDGFEAAFTASLEQELALDEEWVAQDTGFAADEPYADAVEETSYRDAAVRSEPLHSPAEQALNLADLQHSQPESSQLSVFADQQAGDDLDFYAAEQQPETGHEALETSADVGTDHAEDRDRVDPVAAQVVGAWPGSQDDDPLHPLDQAAADAETSFAGPLDPEFELSLEREFENLPAEPVLWHEKRGLLAQPTSAAFEAPAVEPAAVAYTAEPTETQWYEEPADLAGYDTELSGEAAIHEPRELAREYARSGEHALGEEYGAALPVRELAALDLAAEERSSSYFSAVTDEPAINALSSEHDAWNADEFTASLEADMPVAAAWDAPEAVEFSEPADEFEATQPVQEAYGPAAEPYGDSGEQNDHASGEWQDLSHDAQWRPREADEAAFQTANPGFAAAADPVEHTAAVQAHDTALDLPSASDGEPVAIEAGSQDDDPFAALAAMAAQYRAGRQVPNWRPETAFTPALATFNAQPAPAGNGGTMQLKQPVRDEIPEIETVDVPEQPVALADDLDIPDVGYAEQPRAAASYDDLDAEFAGLLHDMASGEPTRPDAVAYRAAPAYEPDLTGYDPTDPRDYTEAANYPVELSGNPAAASVGHTASAYAGEEAGDLSEPAYPSSPERQWSEGSYAAADDLPFGDQNFEQMAIAEEEPREIARPAKRGLLVAAVVGGVALLGAIGAAALSFGDGGVSGAPVLVRADTGPVKVRPENPGGTQVPNQDSTVYDTVTGTPAADPAQEKLVTTEEEPLDVTEPEPEMALGEPQDEVEAAIDTVPGAEAESVQPEAAAGPEAAAEPDAAETDTAETAAPKGELQDEQGITAKGEDRLEQVIAASEQPAATEMIAVAPRKVRTMIVKPDGTLVPREISAPEPAAVEPPPAGTDAVALEPASEAVTANAAEADQVLAGAAADTADAAPVEQVVASNTEEASPETQVSAVSDVAATAAPAAQAAASLGEAAAASAEPAAVATEPAAAPADTAAVVPARKRATQTTPASMRVAPARPAEQPLDIVGEVKADQTAALAAPAAGAWSMQIASQPTEASARSSYADLARRYGSVLAGRGASIVKAEVTGKGTYYRVRVAASSRNEAVELCSRYKAAGGNCFVSK